MGVLNGQVANQTTFNNAFMSRTAATTSTIAEVALQAPSSTPITDTQQFQNDIADTVGLVENDPARKLYTSNNYLVDGENHKDGLESLDVVAGDHETRVSNLEANNSQDITLQPVGSTPAPEGASLTGQALTLQPANATNPGVVTAGAQTIGGDKTFQDDVIINGDLTVQGNVTTLNTATLEVEDQNILVNNGGNDASAEGAGLEVERTGTNGSFKYEDALASKFKLGALGAESEIITAAFAQTMSGNKTFTGQINLQGIPSGDIVTDAATTGANAALPAPSKLFLRLTNAGLTSVSTLTGGQANQFLVLVNVTGAAIQINDTDTGGNDIRTGTGAALSVANQASVWIIKDATSNRWRVVGGSGGGGGTATVANGGTGRTTLTDRAVLIGSGTNPVNFAGPGAVGTFLKGMGAGADPAFSALTEPNVQRFDFTGGNATYTTPAGALYLEVTLVGGGAGGGGGGQSGTAGNGGTGGVTDFMTAGLSLIVRGGAGSNAGTLGTGGGFTVNAPAVAIETTPGQDTRFTAVAAAIATYAMGGMGGNTPLGWGGHGQPNGGGVVAGGHGAGGGGGGTNASVTGSDKFGGAGGGSAGYVKFIIPTPAASYVVNVGGGGSGGTAGTNGFVGGGGVAGKVIIKAHFQ